MKDAKRVGLFQMALSREQAGPGRVASDGVSRRGPVDRVWERRLCPPGPKEQLWESVKPG